MGIQEENICTWCLSLFFLRALIVSSHLISPWHFPFSLDTASVKEKKNWDMKMSLHSSLIKQLLLLINDYFSWNLYASGSHIFAWSWTTSISHSSHEKNESISIFSVSKNLNQNHENSSLLCRGYCFIDLNKSDYDKHRTKKKVIDK